MTIEHSVKVHMDAMVNKDFETFLSTLDLEELVVVSPRGILVNDNVSLLERYRTWFSEKFKLRYEIIEIKERNQLAFILLEVTYVSEENMAQMVEENHYLSLVFDHSEERWRVIFAQYSPQEFA